MVSIPVNALELADSENLPTTNQGNVADRVPSTTVSSFVLGNEIAIAGTDAQAEGGAMMAPQVSVQSEEALGAAEQAAAIPLAHAQVDQGMTDVFETAKTDLSSKQGESSFPVAPVAVTSSSHETEEGKGMEEPQNEEDESGDEEKSSDEDEEPPVENPSTDIRGDLETALDKDLASSFKGSFSFSRTYPDAPNPGLYLHPNDIGAVGLPLSKRDAAAVISGCIQAPFGMGERTVVDTSVRDTWEMDASQVRFDNPVWEAYIQRVVQDVCAALGVDAAISRPRCELYKLLLYETGSHFLPHADTEKVDGMFATIIVILPSNFTGGAAHLSHGPLSTIYDCSAQSALQTTVFSWYTDVMHEIKPITSGYRLALSYNLLHTANTLRPSLPNTDTAVEKLRHVLRSWKQNDVDTGVPRKIVYLLDHKYSQANLRGSALKGADAHKLAILEILAKELDFRLGLASIECTLTGSADDDGGYRRGGHSSSEDDEDLAFLEINDKSMSVTNLVDLEGNVLKKDMEFYEEYDLTIPEDLIEVVEDGLHDRQEYEGYMGNGAGELSRWYRRTALVIWPHCLDDPDMIFENDISDAMDELAQAQAGKPHKRELKLVDFLLMIAVERKEHAECIAQILCDVAMVWRNLGIWQRALKACRATAGISELGNDIIFRSIETFGFVAIWPSLAEMVQNETSNFHRLQFIDELQNWSSTRPDGAIRTWVADQRKNALEHLTKPTPDDSQFLFDLAMRSGGMSVLRDTIVPQLKGIASSEFLVTFVIRLQTEKVKLGVSAEDQAVLTSVVTELILSAISKVDFYATSKPAAAPRGYWQPPAIQPPPDPQLVMKFVDVCLATRNEELLRTVFQQLTNLAGVSVATVHIRVKTVLLPLLPLIEAKTKFRPAGAPALPGIQVLCEEIVRLFLESLSAGPGPTKDDLLQLLKICITHGGVDVVASRIWPALKGAAYRENVTMDFIELLKTHSSQFPASGTGASVQSVISEAVRLVIQKAAFTGYAPAPGYTYYSAWSDPSIHNNRTKALELLDLCLTTGNPQLYGLVFKRMLDSTLAKNEYIDKVLVPFLPELRQFLTKRGLAPSSSPFDTVFKSIVMLWANKVLGPKPKDASSAHISAMQKHTCRCMHCNEIFDFLATSPKRTHRMEKMGAQKRKHVEQELNRHARNAATWATIRSTPQGLTVTKADSIFLPVNWKSTHARVATILNSVSTDTAELRNVFGSDYQVIMDMLAGQTPNIAARQVSNNIPASASTSSHSLLPAAAQHASTSASSVHQGNSSSSIVGDQNPASSSSAAETSRKRKRQYDASDVIDLTCD